MSNNFLVRQILKAGGKFFVGASIAIGTLCPIILTSVPARADFIYTTDIPIETVHELETINNQGITAKTVAFTPSGGYVILYGKHGYSAKNIPSDAANVLSAINKQDSTINTIAFTPKGEWIIIYDFYSAYWSQNFPRDIVNKISELKRELVNVINIGFMPNGEWTIVGTLNGSQVYTSSNVPQDLIDNIKTVSQKSAINSIAFTANGGWLIIYSRGSNVYVNHISQKIFDIIKTKANEGKRFINIAFTPSNGFVLFYDKSNQPTGTPLYPMYPNTIYLNTSPGAPR